MKLRVKIVYGIIGACVGYSSIYFANNKIKR